MDYLSLKDLSFKDIKALVRVDFNVPLNSKGEITDITRIKACVPTIRYILEQGGSVILLSHLGRPDGKKNEKYTLKPCAHTLSTLLQYPVLFASDCLGKEALKQIDSLQPKEVLLLENLRFYPSEEQPDLDPSFAKTLASYGDVYVNDAFGTAHRKHSSTYSLPNFFPGKAVAGFLMEKEIQALSKFVNNPSTPFHVIIGGAKISSKIGVLKAVLNKAQAIYIGGAMAFTFLAAKGISIGDSIYEPGLIKEAQNFLKECKDKNISLFFPVDLIVSNGNSSKIIDISQGIEKGWKGMDIGPKTLVLWTQELSKAKSIFWNGPVGVFEDPLFAKGTFHLAQFLSSLSSERIVGGGDSIAAIDQLHLADHFTHISTGGGASLEFLEYGTLPGIEILSTALHNRDIF